MKLWAILAIAGAAGAQQQPDLRARELFYTAPAEAAAPKAAAQPAPASSAQPGKTTNKKTSATNPPARITNGKIEPVAAVPLGLRYAVLKRDANGKYVEVDADTIFHSGDRIRLQIDANSSGFLYVIHQGSTGAWKPLFPSQEVAGGSNQVQKGEPRIVPPGGQFVFDEHTGTEKLFLVLTRQPQTDLNNKIYSPQNDASPPHLLLAASIGNDVVERMRQQISARDLIFEKVDSPAADGKMEYAAYVVNPSVAPDARLVVDVALKHK
ncbi:MAG TPA: DUF4384 domain-containing protein [Bryobacteraceae bacterium]|jgi:hypothetical protein